MQSLSRNLLGTVEREAPLCESRGGLTDPVVTLLRTAGFARLFVPVAWGGCQGTFLRQYRDVIALAAADASTAWCAAVSSSAARKAAFLPKSAQHAVWGESPDVLLASTLLPGGVARRVADGWLVDGTWRFVSGVSYAEWLLLTCRSGEKTSSDALFVLVPRSACQVSRTWHAAGLRGTASETVDVSSTVVPADRFFRRSELFEGRPREASGTCYDVANDAVSGIAFIAPLVGAAQRAIDLAVGVDADSRDRRALSHHEQAVLTQAAGEVDAAHLLLERAAVTADSGAVDRVAVARARRDYAVAGGLTVNAVNAVHRVVGARMMASGGLFDRIWRDVNAGSVHPAMSLGSAASAYLAAPADK